jgi:hypothetical protein
VIARLFGGPFHGKRLKIDGTPPLIAFTDPERNRQEYEHLALMPDASYVCYGWRTITGGWHPDGAEARSR